MADLHYRNYRAVAFGIDGIISRGAKPNYAIGEVIDANEADRARQFISNLGHRWVGRLALVSDLHEKTVTDFLIENKIIRFFRSSGNVSNRLITSEFNGNGGTNRQNQSRYFELLRRLALEDTPQQLLVIEDTISGAFDAKQTGATVVRLSLDSSVSMIDPAILEEYPPDEIVTSFENLRQAILEPMTIK